MLDLSIYDLDELDIMLASARRASLQRWPYTYDQAVRDIEAEYTRRGEELPEYIAK